MKKIIYIALAIIVLYGCNQRFEKSWDLSVDTELYQISYSVTKLPISVYCTTAWKAELISGQDWAELDRTSGSEVTTIHLTFGENTGLSRQAVIRITSGDAEKIITVIQNPGIKLPQILFEDSSVSYPSGTYIVSTAVDTNIPESYFKNVTPTVAYIEGDGGWITALSLSQETEPLPEESEIPGGVRRAVNFSVSANTSGAIRKAWVSLAIDDKAVSYTHLTLPTKRIV